MQTVQPCMFSPHLQTLTFRWNSWETVARLVLLGEPQGTDFFCLQQKTCSTKQPRIQVEKHMIVTATTEVYIATAFGPWFYSGGFCCSSPDVWCLNLRPWSSESLPRSDSACEACVPLAKMWGEKWDLQIGSQLAMCELWAYGTSMQKLQLLVPDAF